jgi:hypothetical protein
MGEVSDELDNLSKVIKEAEKYFVVLKCNYLSQLYEHIELTLIRKEIK